MKTVSHLFTFCLVLSKLAAKLPNLYSSGGYRVFVVLRRLQSAPISFAGQEFLKVACGQKRGTPPDYLSLFSPAFIEKMKQRPDSKFMNLSWIIGRLLAFEGEARDKVFVGSWEMHWVFYGIILDAQKVRVWEPKGWVKLRIWEPKGWVKLEAI